MFGKLSNKINRVATIDTNQFMSEVFADNDIQADAIELNQKQLYDIGVEADGTPTGNYSKTTIASKMAYGERYDHVTLKDTGKFYASMRVINRGEGIIIYGDSDKGDNDLSDRWSKATGLTPDSIAELSGEIKKVIIIKLKERLNA